MPLVGTLLGILRGRGGKPDDGWAVPSGGWPYPRKINMLASDDESAMNSLCQDFRSSQNSSYAKMGNPAPLVPAYGPLG